MVPIQDGEQAVELIKAEQFDLMISDIRMTPINGMELLKLAHDVRPSMAVIMVTAFGSVETAVEAIKMGAYDYVTKPFKIDELLITVERALEYKRALSENIDLKAQVGALYKFQNIVAESQSMKKVCQMVEHVAPTDTTVLISGPDGSGKHLVAQTLHEQSRRKEAPFLSVDCAAFDEQHLEIEMFGCVSGAAGSDGPQQGAFAQASGGTVFLAHIDALPMPLQRTLLRMLQEKEAIPVGAEAAIPVDVRILAGTSASLQQAIVDGTFREDLFYRLSVIPIDIKPLCDRTEDILPLVYHLILREIDDPAHMPTLEPQARDLLIRYKWPGNVTELSEALAAALTAITDNTLALDALPEAIRVAAGPAAVVGPGGAVDPYRGKSLRSFLKSKEKQYVEQVLDHTKGDKTKAAKALNISLATLYRKLPEQESPENE